MTNRDPKVNGQSGFQKGKCLFHITINFTIHNENFTKHKNF